jgi:alpha-L-fucosidase
MWFDGEWIGEWTEPQGKELYRLCRDLQPNVIVNNRVGKGRSGATGGMSGEGAASDFGTPEQEIPGTGIPGVAWESCMTLNGSWGYQAADDEWKTAKTIVKNLISCSRDGGNYLLNIGPRGDGSIPEPSVHVLETVGAWMEKHGDTIYGSDPCQPRRSSYAMFTRKGNTLYMHVHAWPGDTLALAGLLVPVKSIRVRATRDRVRFQQDKLRVSMTGLPHAAPEQPLTTIEIECDAEPKQDQYVVRNGRERLHA